MATQIDVDSEGNEFPLSLSDAKAGQIIELINGGITKLDNVIELIQGGMELMDAADDYATQLLNIL
jgi:hypothetical protein